MPRLALPLLTLFLFLAVICSRTVAATATYNVMDYGADPSGRTDSTRAFSRAWGKACASRAPAMMYVPGGSFSVRRLRLQGSCNSKSVEIRIDGQLMAPSDYNVLGSRKSWISIESVEGVSVSGGVLDGKGGSLWACKASSGSKSCPRGATTLEIANSKRVVISGVTSLNSQLGHISINGCENVRLDGVKVSASDRSPNTDGIHVQSSSDVMISNSEVGTGDDCVSIGPGTNNLFIQDMHCGPGHGISIGSLGKELNEEGVRNVTVKHVQLKGTQNGLRIKSWGRPSTGFAEDILFEDAVMSEVHNPIVIDQNYCPHHLGCPNQESGIRVSDVTYRDVHGTSASKVAVKFDCSPERPCRGIRMEDVEITYNNHPAESYCANAGGIVLGSVQPNSCLQL